MSSEKTDKDSKQKMVIFYHGTSKERVVCKGGIYEKGLDASKGGTGNTAISGGYGSTSYGDASNNKNHFTTVYDTALSYALQTSKGLKSDAVVLAIQVSEDYAVQNFQTDMGNTKKDPVAYSTNSEATSFTTTKSFPNADLYLAKNANDLTKMNECNIIRLAYGQAEENRKKILQSFSIEEDKKKAESQALASNNSTSSSSNSSKESDIANKKGTSLMDLINKIHVTKNTNQTQKDSDDEWDNDKGNTNTHSM